MIEFGSDFHYINDQRWLLKPGQTPYFRPDCSFFVSGRAALFNLVLLGIERHDWQRIFVPDYYCHEVTECLSKLQIEIIPYNYIPGSGAPSGDFDHIGNAVVSVNFFGLLNPDFPTFKHAHLIADVTHALSESKTSTADYCFGSLRKELPVPCGGFVSSPKNLPLPSAEPSRPAEEIAVQKLTAMFLKSQYLENKFHDKPYFRQLYADAESRFELEYSSGMPAIAKLCLDKLDVESILEAKIENVSAALEILGNGPRFNLGTGKTGLGLTIVCESNDQRDRLRAALIENNVFPAVLWPDQNTADTVDFSSKVLFVHMDFRYSAQHAKAIATIIKTFFE